MTTGITTQRIAFGLFIIFALVGCQGKLGAKADGSAVELENHSTGTQTSTATATATEYSATSGHHFFGFVGGSTQNLDPNASTLISYSVQEDPAKQYNSDGKIFTAAMSGIFQISVGLTVKGGYAAGNWCQVSISQTQVGPIASNRHVMPETSADCAVSLSIAIRLQRGESFTVVGDIAASGQRGLREGSGGKNRYNYLTVALVSH